MAFQSSRLWHWQEREKLLLMAWLVYAFFLTLFEPFDDPLRVWLLRTFGHRTGWHCRMAKAPLSRVRSALSQLWQKHPPTFALLGQRAVPSVRVLAGSAHPQKPSPFLALPQDGAHPRGCSLQMSSLK